MPRPILTAVVALAICGSHAAAQASPYIPLDDPRLPALEHLIALGDIEDPSPMVRPFRRIDAIRALAKADSAGTARDTSMVRELLEAFADPGDKARWKIEPRAGGQAYSDARRDMVHPAGPDGVQPYVELGLTGVFGNVGLVSRPAIETRLPDDPDWIGRKNLDVTGRMVEAYLTAQFKWFSAFYGQMDQEWGPQGVYGVSLSAFGYGRPTLAVEIGNRQLKLLAQASQLRDENDTLNQVVKRYYFAHRLSAQLTRRFNIALWETTVLSGVDRSFDGRFRNPVTLLLLANEYGIGDDGNVLVGLDLQWRFLQHTTLALQLAVDDIQYKNRGGPDTPPDRYAFTIAAFGPLHRSIAWRALYTQASSLAFRSSDPFENFTDAGVGIGRNFADDDQLSFFATAPLTRHWLVTPELTLSRQGEGSLDDPFPPSGAARGNTPTLFIGTVEKTWRAAVGITGAQGPVRLSASAGYHHVTNAGNVSGKSDDRFVGKIGVTLGFSTSGVLHD
ncbi:MAG TPA: hypothetical protein VH438_02865 [Gemmatimonadales bacterium]